VVVHSPPVAEDLVGWSAPSAVVEEALADDALLDPPTARSREEAVFAFRPGEVHTIDVSIGAPFDIVLQPGEEVYNIVGGDRAPAEGQDTTLRWEVNQGFSGTGKRGRPHVFLAVTKPGLTTSLVITTTRRTYYLDCRSVAKHRTRSIRWTYTDEPQLAKPASPRLLPDPLVPQRYHVGYEVTTSDPPPPWTVRTVVDNGAKTYLIFPPVLSSIEAPLVRAVGVNGPELINARQVGSVIVLDRIINRLELRLGTGKTAEVVTVQRHTPRSITCPGDEACPVWPGQAVVEKGGPG
jgi:type IV secretion system protein VirB9